MFGYNVYAYDPMPDRSKLDAKARKCIFLGYQRRINGYRLWDPLTNRIIISRDISFNESKSLKEDKNAQTSQIDIDKSKDPTSQDETVGGSNHRQFGDWIEIDVYGYTE